MLRIGGRVTTQLSHLLFRKELRCVVMPEEQLQLISYTSKTKCWQQLKL